MYPISTARQLAKHYTQYVKTPIVDIDAICADEKINVIDETFEFINRPDEPNLSRHAAFAVSIDTKTNEKDIYMDTKTEETTRRFHMACALYFHLALHNKAEKIVEFRCKRCKDDDALYIDAITFATELLIQTDMVRKKHKALLFPLTKSLAETFCVPERVMKIKLDQMELTYIL